MIFVSAHGFYTAPGEVTAEAFDDENENDLVSKISNGKPLKRGEFLEFCYLSIQFNNKFQTCGCFIWNKNFVVTTARCVQE